MKNNLKYLREKSSLTAKQLSTLLCLSQRNYLAMEQGIYTMLPELIIMVSRIYQIRTRIIFDDITLYEDEVEVETGKYAQLTEKERFEQALFNLIGEEPRKQYRKRLFKLRDNLNKYCNS